MTFLLAMAADAQTIRDKVKDHVEDSLEKEKAKARKKADQRKHQKTSKESAEDASAPEPEIAPTETEAVSVSEEPEPEAFPLDEPDEDDDANEDEPALVVESPDEISDEIPPPDIGDTTPGSEHAPVTPAYPAPVKEDPAKSSGPKLPRRVIHENFKLDLQASGGYRGWAPQQYPSVSVDPANFFTWSVGATGRFFKVVSLSKVRYESNSAASPRKSYVASATKYGSWGLKAAWFLAELGIDALEKFQPLVRYESRHFVTHARAEDGADVCVVPFNQDADVEDCQTEEGELTITSSLETAAVGLKFHPKGGSQVLINDKPAKAPSFFLGGGYLSYLKPYQVTIGEFVLDEYLFTGRFYGGGLAAGLNFGGGVNRPYIDAWLQLGIGRVRLTRDMTLNELAPDDWLIGYIQGNLKAAFAWAPFEFAPTILIVPSGTFSGASFFFFETEVDEGEETAVPSINWDILYTVRLALVITL